MQPQDSLTTQTVRYANPPQSHGGKNIKLEQWFSTPISPITSKTTGILKSHSLWFSMFLFYFIYLFCFFRATLSAYGSSQARVKSELQLPACATAIATWYLSHICNLHHSSWQHQISDLLSKAREQTCILMDASLISFCCATMGTPAVWFLKLTYDPTDFCKWSRWPPNTEKSWLEARHCLLKVC